MLSKLPLCAKQIIVSLCILAIPAAAKAAQPSYPNEQKIVFTPQKGEAVNAYQGFIEVKENRNATNSKLIKVHYVRFPATGNKTGAPIVYLAGGPGGSGVLTAKGRRFPMFMAMREFGDVIALDQRGTGLSESAPKCTSKQKLPLDQVHTEKQVAQKYKAAANECVSFWTQQGFDIQGYTTQQNALDINDLRQHLNADKVSLWGISYGSHLAFSAVKLMGKHVDKVIVASAEGLNQTVKLPSRTDMYFDSIQQVINQQPSLAARFPDIKKMMTAVHQKLNANPITLQVPQKDGSSKTMLFQKFHMQALASMTIADPGRYLSMLLNLYQSVHTGNNQMLTGVLQRGMFNDEAISFRLMPFAMDIASGISDTRLQQVKQQSQQSLLGEVLNFPMPMLNKAVVGLDLGDSFREEVQSDVPTLLLSGTLDGRTYMDGQLEATQGFTKLNHVVVENAGHNLFMSSPLVLKSMQDFMRGKPVRQLPITLPLPSL